MANSESLHVTLQICILGTQQLVACAAGKTLKEANFINTSLTFLEQTVNALCRKDAHVPFRQTKLTAVLRDALGGNSKTVSAPNEL